MPIIKSLLLGGTAGAARTLVSSNSWQKRPMIFVKTNGEKVEIEPGLNALETFGPLAEEGEKDRLLQLKAEGYRSVIKDTAAKYKSLPKEWDHLILAFDKEESFLLTDEEKERYREALIKAFAEPAPFTGGGRRMVAISEGHDDTGAFHFHLLVHRHGVDHEKKFIHTSFDLGRYSESSTQANRLNEVLAEENLEQITDWIGTRGSIYESFGGPSPEAKAMVSQALQEAGGEADLTVTPGKSPGVARAEREEQAPLSADEKLVKHFVDFQQREALRLAEELKRTTEQAALGQQALAAFREKKEAQTALEKAQEEKAQLGQEVASLREESEQFKAKLEDFTTRLEAQESKLQNFTAAVAVAVDTMPASVRKLPPEDQGAWLANTVLAAANSISQLASDKLVPADVAKKDPSNQVSWLAKEFREQAQAMEGMGEQIRRQREELKAAEKVKHELQVVQKNLGEVVKREEKLTAKVEELTQVSTAAQAELRTATEQVSTLSGQLTSSSAMVKQSQELVKQQLEMIESQSLQIVQSQDLLRRNEERIANQAEQLKKFEQQITAAEKQEKTRVQELESTKKALEEALAEVKRLREIPKSPAISQKGSELIDQIIDESKKKKKGPGPKNDEGGPK